MRLLGKEIDSASLSRIEEEHISKIEYFKEVDAKSSLEIETKTGIKNYIRLDTTDDVIAFGLYLKMKLGYSDELMGKSIARLLRSYREFPLRYFVPNKIQESVINEIERGYLNGQKIYQVIVTGANGMGKTALETALICILSTWNITEERYHNEWFNKNFVRNWRYKRNFWLFSTPSSLKENILNYLLGYLGPLKGGIIKYHVSKDGNQPKMLTIYDKNERINAITSFKSYEQDADSRESGNVGFIPLDEPADAYTYSQCLTRLRMGGLLLYCATPLCTEPYIKELVESKKRGIYSKQFVLFDAITRAMTPTEYAEVRDKFESCNLNIDNYYNAESVKSNRGHFDTENAVSQILLFTESDLRTRVLGEFGAMLTTIFPEINPHIHFLDKNNEKNIDIRYNVLEDIIIQGIDPAGGRLSAVTYTVIKPDGRAIVIKEFPEFRGRYLWELRRESVSLEDELKQWMIFEKEELGLGSSKIVYRVVDGRYGFQLNSGANNWYHDVVSLSKKIGWSMDFIPSARKIDLGANTGEIMFGHDLIRRRIINILPDGYPAFIIDNDCHNTKKAILEYRYIYSENTQNKKAVGSGKIVETYKDLLDCIRYTICLLETHPSIVTKSRKFDIKYGKYIERKKEYKPALTVKRDAFSSFRGNRW